MLIYEADGIFRTEEELNSYPHLAGVRVGDIRFRDINEDGIINASDRIRPDKPTIPRIMYGLIWELLIKACLKYAISRSCECLAVYV